jgi:ABC-2 type transport system permease protein
MKTLVRTEWLKMRKYKAFWGMMILTILAYPGINTIIYQIYKEVTGRADETAVAAKMILGNPFSFPEVWHTVAYASSIFVFIPALVIIMFITNEYTFRTHRQNIIDGWSRSQFVTSKLVDVLIITFIITMLYTVVALVIGLSAHERLIRDTWGMMYYIGLFALQTFAQLSIAFLVGFLVRKAFLALGIFLFYFLVFEPIAVNLLREFSNDEGRFLPLEISDRMIPVPQFLGKLNMERYNKSIDAIPQYVILSVILTTLVWLLCYRINNRRDLK